MACVTDLPRVWEGRRDHRNERATVRDSKYWSAVNRSDVEIGMPARVASELSHSIKVAQRRDHEWRPPHTQQSTTCVDKGMTSNAVGVISRPVEIAWPVFGQRMATILMAPHMYLDAMLDRLTTGQPCFARNPQLHLVCSRNC